MRISDWSSDVCSSDLAVGTGALLWAYALGVSRSRTDAVTLGGLFFLADGTAPPDVRRPFRVALAVEVVAVVAAAAIHPFTQVAFGILAPMFALGLMGMWGGRYGRSEEHTSELQSLMRISYAVFCLKKNTTQRQQKAQQ